MKSVIEWDKRYGSFAPFPGEHYNSSLGFDIKSVGSGDFLAVSNPKGGNYFTMYKEFMARDLKKLKSPGMITPIQNNNLHMSFRSPAVQARKGTSTVGAIYLDVDRDDDTHISYYDKNSCLIAEQPVRKQNNGASFVGIHVYGERDINADVYARVTLGNAPTTDTRHEWAADYVAMGPVMWRPTVVFRGTGGLSSSI